MTPTVPEPIAYRTAGRALTFRQAPLGIAEGERDLARTGVAIPVDHRSAWARALGLEGRVAEVWTPPPERCLGTVVVEVSPSRALPAYELWRVDRVGGYAEEAILVTLEGLRDAAAREKRVVQVAVGLASADPDTRDRWARFAADLGYRRADAPRQYARTSRLDLTAPADALLGRMRPSCRRGLRAAQKHAMEVRPIDRPELAPRVAELMRETMGRTRGPAGPLSWTGIIDYARENPAEARLVGTFTTDGAEPRLLAFALGLRQGDHVEYRAAASTREGVRVPLGYALVWDLMLWAKDVGATWFDFGGMPEPDDVPPLLEGIVRFKESFGGETIPFREEWLFEPRPLLAAVRRGLSRSARLVERWRRP